MEPALVSCIVPVFNGERYLATTLDSILQQTYRPLEVIVVDDGSTDGTRVVATGYGQRVSYLWQSNAGPTAARNLGLHAARGEFIAFLDADDLWHPEKLTRQMARFHACPELGLCFTHVQNFCTPELTAERTVHSNHAPFEPLPGYVSIAMVVRRTLFDTIGEFDPSLQHASDTDWIMRARERGVVIELLPEVLVYRRLHDSNRSRLHAAASRDEFLDMLKASLDRKRNRRRNSTPTPRGSAP